MKMEVLRSIKIYLGDKNTLQIEAFVYEYISTHVNIASNKIDKSCRF